MQRGSPRVIRRPCREISRARRRITEDGAVLSQPSHRDEGVQQHFRGARVAAHAGSYLSGGRPASHGGKQIQLDGRQDHPAFLKSSQGAVHLVGKDAGGSLRALRGYGLVAVGADFLLESGRILIRQALHNLSTLKVRFHDFRHVLRPHA